MMFLQDQHWPPEIYDDKKLPKMAGSQLPKYDTHRRLKMESNQNQTREKLIHELLNNADQRPDQTYSMIGKNFDSMSSSGDDKSS